MNRICTGIVLILSLTLSATALADKTDIVILKNGDKITGEVKDLHRGRLQFSTDSMGTVYIDWKDIQAVISETGQSVELSNGQRFFGPLKKSENTDMVAVETEEGVVGLGINDVVGMYPVEAGFWDRLEIRTKLGFTWDKASSVGKYNIGVETQYRDPRFITRASFNTEVTSQQGRDDTARSSLAASHYAFRPNKRFTSYFSSAEKNDQLGLDLRMLVGAGYGWVPIRSNRNWFSLVGGLDVNKEIPREGESETNIEAVGALSYEYYRYEDPERTFSTNLILFPSITDMGRWRSSFKSDFKLEFISDLFWVMSLFAEYDSDPIDDEAAHSDYGVTSSFEYKF
jgi:hypothetical protein